MELYKITEMLENNGYEDPTFNKDKTVTVYDSISKEQTTFTHNEIVAMVELDKLRATISLRCYAQERVKRNSKYEH